MLFECPEVAVRMQQAQAAGHAARGDENVYSPPNSHTQPAQRAVVTRSLDRNVTSRYVNLPKAAKKAPRFLEPAVIAESLKHLHQDQIADDERLQPEMAIQPLDLRRRPVAKEIDPHA